MSDLSINRLRGEKGYQPWFLMNSAPILPFINRKFAISLLEEMVAYETLWARRDQTLKTIASLFRKHHVPPSSLLEKQDDFFRRDGLASEVRKFLAPKTGFSIAVHGDFVYPEKLQQAKYPIELFYYKGDIGVLDSRCVSVVGSRKSSEHGEK